MAMVGVFLFAMLLPLYHAGASALASAKERPVMKVVRLLQDMSVELQKELDDDKQVHDMLGCWCETNNKEKTQAIEVGKAKISQLQASMDENVAKMLELKEKRKATMDEINSDHATLVKAEEMRIKESKAFQGEETDLLEAVAACKQAVVVLGKHNPGLAQLRTVARRLQDSRISQLVSSSPSLRRDQLLTLKGFLQEAGGSSSFLRIPGYQSYAPRSGQIFGILKQMQEDFEANLSEAQKAELKAREDYKALKTAKQDEIAAGQKSVVQIDGDLGAFSEKHAQEAQQHEDTETQLDLDQQFLASLTTKCSESEAEYEARLKSRMDEIAAVADTIKILNSDESFDVFDQAVNTAFVQVSIASHEERMRRTQAASVLQRAADRTQMPQLALIATMAQLDAFTQVKAEIDKLLAELGKQMEDEVAHRDWCTQELSVNDRDTAAADDKKAALETKIADLAKTISSLTSDIDSAKAAIAEMEKQMSRASHNRESEDAEYQQTIADQRLTQTILQKAIDRMKEVYAFLQQQPGAAHIATSGNHTDAGNGPARFTKYEQNTGGLKVVSMLETVLTDSKKTEDEAIRSEEDSQTAYESFMKDSNKGITKYLESISSMSGARAKAKSAQSMAEADLKQTVKDLEGLGELLGDLHSSCDFILNNFEARQAARTAEMESLKEAKAILSGMK